MTTIVFRFIAYSFLPILFACQSGHHIIDRHHFQAENSQSLYLDQAYITDKPYLIETEQQIFALDDEMREMVSTKLDNNLSAHKKARILLDHLFSQEHIDLRYQGDANVIAQDAYHSAQANCMSLTIMAYALASEADIRVDFQSVDVPEYWVRNGQYNLITGHVNLIIKEKHDDDKDYLWAERVTQIDFDPFVAKKKFTSHVIKKKTLVAMFYNNKGAQALVDNNYQLAYLYFKQATIADKHFDSAWGNLGILYKLSDQHQLAEKTYRHALSLKRNNLTTLGNLSLLLSEQGQLTQAKQIDDYIHNIRARNPYYHALLGNKALNKSDSLQAIKHFKRAIQLDDEQHEFYFGLAQAYYQNNDLMLAQRAMKAAIKLTDETQSHRQYTAKLNVLNRH